MKKTTFARILLYIALFAACAVALAAMGVYGAMGRYTAEQQARQATALAGDLTPETLREGQRALFSEKAVSVESLAAAAASCIQTDDKSVQAAVKRLRRQSEDKFLDMIDEFIAEGTLDAGAYLAAVQNAVDENLAVTAGLDALSAEEIYQQVEKRSSGFMSLSFFEKLRYYAMSSWKVFLVIAVVAVAGAAALFTVNRRGSEELRRSVSNTIEAANYLLPFMLSVAIFTLYPIVNVVLLSFKEGYEMLSGEFSSIGLGNYQYVLEDQYFAMALKNTGAYVLWVVPLSTCIAILLATLLNRKLRGMAIFQTAYFLPMVTSVTAAGLAWRWMFHSDFGVINQILSWFGIDKIKWLSDPAWSMPALVIYGIWSILPFTIILLLSGLQNIDESYYTVARVDGAKSKRIFFRITLPLLSPTVGLVLIINSISTAKVFSEMFPIFNGRPGPSYNLYTMVYYIYDQFYVKFKLGRAAAAALLLFFIIFIFTMIQLFIQRKWQHV